MNHVRTMPVVDSLGPPAAFSFAARLARVVLAAAVAFALAAAGRAQAPANDEVSGAYALVPGGNPAVYATAYSNAGATDSPSIPGGCGITASGDVWFFIEPTWVGTTHVRTCGWPGPAYYGGAEDTVLFAYGAFGPGVGVVTACDDDSCSDLRSDLTFFAIPGFRTYIRVASYAGTAPGMFAVEVAPPAPTNDEPAAAIVVVDGVNPVPAPGAAQGSFTNFGATATAGYETCLTYTLGTGGFPTIPGGGPQPVTVTIPGYHDVFFSYVATTTATTGVSTCPAAGGAAADIEAIVEVYDGPTRVGCANANCGAANEHARAEFLAVAGTTYLIRVSSGLPYGWGSFRLAIEPRLTLSLSAPYGAGSIRAWVGGGEPFASYYSFFTLTPGDYPTGWFYGIAPSMTEIFLQLAAAGAPFSGLLDAGGSRRFDVVGGLPPVTVYGVTLTFGAAGAFDVSSPTSFTIL